MPVLKSLSFTTLPKNSNDPAPCAGLTSWLSLKNRSFC
jgi:hypothetical protein